jgi:hypothetical protein
MIDHAHLGGEVSLYLLPRLRSFTKEGGMDVYLGKKLIGSADPNQSVPWTLTLQEVMPATTLAGTTPSVVAGMVAMAGAGLAVGRTM